MPMVRGLVVALASVTLAVAGLGAARATEAGTRLLVHHPAGDPGRPVVDQITALRRQLVAAVPPGARILVGDVPPGYLGWQQRIVEVATLEHHRVVADPAGADYLVSIVEEPAGLRLVAKAIR